MSSLRPYVEPIPNVPLQEFPQSELPEGCTAVDLPPDNGLYQVEYHEVTYVVRKMDNGCHCPRKMYVLVPIGTDPIHAIHNKTFPCVVFVQGSAWRTQNLYGHFTDLVRLAEKGFVVACVQYRETSIAPFPAQEQDVKTAIRYLRAHASEFMLDPERIGLWGDSSGAHTAALVAFTADGPASVKVEGRSFALDTSDYGDQSAEVSCVVDWYGPMALEEMNCVPSAQDHTKPNSPEGALLNGRNPRTHPEWARAASPLTYIPQVFDRKLPPVLIMHGGRDQLVNFEQSVLLFNVLRAAGQDVEFYQIPNAHHGSNGFRTAEALAMVERFLRAHL